MHEIPGINSVQYSQFMQKEWIVREKRLAGIKNAMREALEQGESIDTLIAQALSVRHDHVVGERIQAVIDGRSCHEQLLRTKYGLYDPFRLRKGRPDALYGISGI